MPVGGCFGAAVSPKTHRPVVPESRNERALVQAVGRAATSAIRIAALGGSRGASNFDDFAGANGLGLLMAEYHGVARQLAAQQR